MRQKTSFVFPLIVFSFVSTFSQQGVSIIEKEGFSIGESVTIHSSILDEDRVLNIYLPLSYESDRTKKYPVIYLLDGSKDEDFIHIAGLVQFGSFSWINFVPESIVVGIANVDRKRDFTFPSQDPRDQEGFPTSGGASHFISFLGKELQPFIESQYRVQAPKTLLGQSLGGLLATEILFNHPELFEQYIIISPSLWWDNESLSQTLPKPGLSGKKIYIGVGKEGEIMERLAKELYEKLSSILLGKEDLYFQFFEKLDHGDVLHLAAYDAFEKLFSNGEK